jgi:hypothetical protein
MALQSVPEQRKSRKTEKQKERNAKTQRSREPEKRKSEEEKKKKKRKTVGGKEVKAKAGRHKIKQKNPPTITLPLKNHISQLVPIIGSVPSQRPSRRHRPERGIPGGAGDFGFWAGILVMVYLVFPPKMVIHPRKT